MLCMLSGKADTLPFDISESKTNDVFEIIHCDICDSYKIASFYGAHFFNHC